MDNSNTIAEIKQALELLHRPGDVVEVRALNTPQGTISGYFNDFDLLAKAAAELSGKVPAVYVTLNPVNPALLARRANKLVGRVRETTSDADILCRRWLPLDFDPVRPSGISSTDEEHELALERARQVRGWLYDLGWPDPILADSGNGAHLLYRIDLPNDEYSRRLLEDVLKAIAFHHGDTQVAVDEKVFNAGRIWKLYGTISCKGENLPERPHRLARLLEVPAKIEVVPPALLEKVGFMQPKTTVLVHEGERKKYTPESGFDLEAWIKEHNLPVVAEGPWGIGGRKWILNPCPWNPEHTNKAAYIVQFANGAIAAGCHHNGCAEKDWHALRDLYEPGWRSQRNNPAQRIRAKKQTELNNEEKSKESQADALIRLGLAATLFHDEENEPFATIPVGEHREIWPVRSRYFRRWLAGQFFEETGRAPNTDAINQALNVLEAAAVFRGKRHRLNLRVAEHEGAFWYDLGDSAWRAVKITADGWEIVKDPPILFRRYQNTGAQVMPERGGGLRKFLELVNVRTEDERILLLVYAVTALVPEIPKPILDVYGEKGAGKSTLLRMLRALIDPGVEPLLVVRHDDREMAIQLAHNYAPFFDNLSGLSQWQSDMLCRAATGAGLSVRALYTDEEERIFRFKRAVGVNGIHLLTGGTDLQDRFLTIELERIEKTARRQEQDVLSEFERFRPCLFGAMLDALSEAMRIKPSLKFDELPRMADFAVWGAAVAEALGFGANRFLAAYWRNIGAVSERILHSHPVAAATVALLEEIPIWEGTPAELLERLERVAEREKINIRSKSWPKSANSLSKRLKELASNFADAGIALEMGRDSTVQRRRYIRLQRLVKEPSEPSEASRALKNLAFSSDDTSDDSEGLPSETVREPSEEKARSGAGLDGLDGSDDTLPLLPEEPEDLTEVMI